MLRVTSNGAYAMIFRYVEDHPGATAAEVAAGLGRDRRGTLPILRKLALRGFLRVSTDGAAGGRWGDRPVNRYRVAASPPPATPPAPRRKGLFAGVEACIGERPGATRGEVADALGVPPKSLKWPLRQLAASGRVTVTPGAPDARRYWPAGEDGDPPPPSEREIAEMCEAIRAARTSKDWWLQGERPRDWEVPVVRLSVGRA